MGNLLNCGRLYQYSFVKSGFHFNLILSGESAIVFQDHQTLSDAWLYHEGEEAEHGGRGCCSEVGHTVPAPQPVCPATGKEEE